MKKQNWIWMPHAGHFIASSYCQFRINTYVGKYIVSTVGEKTDHPESREIKEIGFGRKYETMVFKAKKSKNKCCPWEQDSGIEIDFNAYNDSDSAYSGHLKMCKKWSEK